jgi:hypothetical protein
VTTETPRPKPDVLDAFIVRPSNLPAQRHAIWLAIAYAQYGRLQDEWIAGRRDHPTATALAVAAHTLLDAQVEIGVELAKPGTVQFFKTQAEEWKG